MRSTVDVLMVDDEPNLLELDKVFLEAGGKMAVRTALSGREALEALNEREFDVIVSDYQMPEMDGLELLREVKRRGIDTPFILFTGRGREEVAVQALNIGASYYLQKGIDARSQFAELENMIRRSAEAARSRRELLESEAKYRSLFRDNAAVMLLIEPSTGRIIDANQAASDYYGYSLAELTGMLISDINTLPYEKVREEMGRSVHDNVRRFVFRHRLSSGEVRDVEVYTSPVMVGGRPRLYSIVHDITERRRAEQEREAAVGILRLINEGRTTADLVRAATAYFQDRSGCEAVGIRLQDGVDFPYFETRGFPPQFVEMERLLCRYDEGGDAERDRAGNPVLECMCGNVICGRFDPAKPFFTGNGSFWTNSTTDLLASTSDADRQARTRNRCNGEGYESVALIPLRVGQQRLGLIQLNDRRRGMFTPQLIALWERLAGYLAVALARFRSEERLRDSESRLRTIVDVLPVGVLITDASGRAVLTNRALGEMWRGSRPLEAAEQYAEYRAWRLDDGEPVRPEDWPVMRAIRSGAPDDGFVFRFRRFDGTVGIMIASAVPLKDDEGSVVGGVAICHDVTERRVTENALGESERRYRALFENSFDAIFLTRPDGTILAANPAACRLLGMTEGEIRSAGRDGLVVHDGGLASLLQERERSGQAKGRLTMRRRDGTTVTVEVTSSLFTDADGITKTSMIAREVSGRGEGEQ